MTSKLMLSALATVAAIAVVAAPQDPSFEYPSAKHVGFDQARPQQQEITIAVAATDQVSASFKNATIGEVLDWLKGQNINFVVQDDQVDRDARVNVNVINQPVEDLMTALASAWKGHWEKRNDIWVFHKGSDFFAPAIPATPGLAAPKLAPGAPGIRVAPKIPEARAWVMPALPQTPMTKEQRQALEKSMKELNDPKKWEEFNKSMEKWSKDFEKNMEQFQKEHPGKEFHMDPKAMEQLHKSMAELGKVNDLRFYRDGAEISGLDQREIETIQKRALDAAKSAEKMRVYTLPSAPGVTGYSFDGEKMKPLTKEQLKALRERTMTAPRVAPVPGVNFANGMSSHNLKSIYESLTPAQTQILKTKGYLNYSDLNAKQRGMLGVISDDSWTISYKTDSVNLTIKSDR